MKAWGKKKKNERDREGVDRPEDNIKVSRPNLAHPPNLARPSAAVTPRRRATPYS